MENICPLCNGLFQETEYCPNCQQPLTDMGKIESFWGPYSPYQEEDLYVWQQEVEHPELADDYCVHLFSCPKCNYDRQVPVRIL